MCCALWWFAVPILGTEYAARNGCYIAEGNDGGSYDNLYTAESCAQLCMNDPCCTSFDSGVGPNAYDCNLSYDTAASKPDQFVCDASKNFNYYEKMSK